MLPTNGDEDRTKFPTRYICWPPWNRIGWKSRVCYTAVLPLKLELTNWPNADLPSHNFARSYRCVLSLLQNVSTAKRFTASRYVCNVCGRNDWGTVIAFQEMKMLAINTALEMCHRWRRWKSARPGLSYPRRIADLQLVKDVAANFACVATQRLKTGLSAS